MRGESNDGNGLSGFSTDFTGVFGSSTSGTGVRAVSSSGNIMDGYGANAVRKFHIDNNGVYTAGSDFAEALPVLGDRAGYEPGDVLVLSAERAGALDRSQQPADPRVAGVYSTRPAVLGADKGGESRVDPDDVPLAIVGIVPTKVSAENGPIAVGDLLMTASTAGHAMRATLPAPQGTLLGKALEPLPAGTGVIRVLVSLR